MNDQTNVARLNTEVKSVLLTFNQILINGGLVTSSDDEY